MDDPQELITRILDWSEHHPEFDTMFVVDLQEQLDQWGNLKPTQVAALKNIIKTWKIYN
jgi:hypothetical protein